MNHQIIHKRCENCNKLFSIPKIKNSKAMDYIFRFYPCTFCGYVKGKVFNIKKKERKSWLELNRCIDCFTPFTVKYHCKGRCMACYQRNRRAMLQKTANK